MRELFLFIGGLKECILLIRTKTKKKELFSDEIWWWNFFTLLVLEKSELFWKRIIGDFSSLLA